MGVTVTGKVGRVVGDATPVSGRRKNGNLKRGERTCMCPSAWVSDGSSTVHVGGGGMEALAVHPYLAYLTLMSKHDRHSQKYRRNSEKIQRRQFK